MGARILCAVLVGLAVLASGCREERAKMPIACLDGPDAIRTALARAPGDVSIDGTKLSECFVKTPETGDLQAFGGAAIEVATDLSVAAVKDPTGEEALQLGYLNGALRRGADVGIHDELLRRLDQELIGLDRSPAFRRGDQAGRAGG